MREPNTGRRIRRLLRIAALLLTIGAVLTLCACGHSTAALTSVRFLVNGGEAVNLCMDESGNTAYVFLPSYAELPQTVISLPEGARATIGKVSLTDGMDCAAFEIGEEYLFSVKGAPRRMMVFLRSANAAALFLTADSADFAHVQADKEYRADISAALYTADGAVDYVSGVGDRISGRGNTTWFLEKKPYNLRLDAPADLLGMGPAKKWSLLANGYDETDLRNKLILDFAREIEPYDGFSPECAFTDLYVNGAYQGLYLMCKSTNDATAEFLDTKSDDAYEIEMTLTSKMDPNDPAIRLNDTMSAEIKVPSKVSAEQEAALADLIGELEAWLRSNEPEPETLRPDIDSLARKILLETMFEDYDGATASQYFWGSLSDRTFYAGPCWDYDLTMGTYFSDWSTPHAIIAFKDWNGGADVSWYHGLWGKPAIRDHALALYRGEFRSLLQTYLDSRIQEQADAIAAAAEMDRIRWPGLHLDYDSHQQAVESMIEFMREHLAFLDALWIDGADFCEITMKLPNGRMLNCYVPSGEVCEDLPRPYQVSLQYEGMEFVTIWYREDTGEPFDPNTPITEDLVLYAKRQ